jgi:hypothetical protein
MAFTKKELMERLMALPVEINNEEITLIVRQYELLDVKNTLQQAKDQLYIDGVIDGKNAEIRDAQLRQRTTIEQNAVNKATELVDRQKHEVTLLQNELVALRAVVDLLKGAA